MKNNENKLLEKDVIELINSNILYKNILEAIGKHALFSYSKIFKYCKNLDDKLENIKIEEFINTLLYNGVLSIEKISTFSRPTGYRILSLSDNLGKRIFKELFNEEVALNEREKLSNKDLKLSSIYSLKDVYNVLSNAGYTDISVNDPLNDNFPTQKYWLPDIKALNPTTNKIEYFNLVFSSASFASIEAKLDDICSKTEIFNLLVLNRIVFQKTLEKVNEWKDANPDKLNNLTINVRTYFNFIMDPFLEDKE